MNARRWLDFRGAFRCIGGKYAGHIPLSICLKWHISAFRGACVESASGGYSGRRTRSCQDGALRCEGFSAGTGLVFVRVDDLEPVRVFHFDMDSKV